MLEKEFGVARPLVSNRKVNLSVVCALGEQSPAGAAPGRAGAGGTGVRGPCTPRGVGLWPGPGSPIYRKNSLSAYFGGDLFRDFRLNFHQTESEYIFTPELNQAEIEPSGTC